MIRPLIVAILAGGGSRRMGRDKAFVAVDGRPMIAHVIGAVAEAPLPAVIIAPRTPDYLALGLDVHEDKIPGMGPLSGLHTAFAVSQAERVLLIACDMPGVRPEVLRLLAGWEMGEADGAIPFVGGKEQGLLAVYRRHAVERALPAMEEGTIQFDTFRQGLTVARIGEEALRMVDPDLRSFDNLNRPEEVDAWAVARRG